MKHYIVSKKPLVVHGQDIKPGTTLGTLDVPGDMPIKRLLATLSNGCAQLQDREEPAEVAKPAESTADNTAAVAVDPPADKPGKGRIDPKSDATA